MDRPEFVLFRDTWGERVNTTWGERVNTTWGERVNTAMKIRGSIKWRISVPPESLVAYKLCYTELAIIQIYLFFIFAPCILGMKISLLKSN